MVVKGRIFDDDDDDEEDEMTRFAKSQTSAQFVIQQCIKTLKMTFCSSFQFQLSQTSKPSGRTWNFMVVLGGLEDSNLSKGRSVKLCQYQ